MFEAIKFCPMAFIKYPFLMLLHWLSLPVAYVNSPFIAGYSVLTGKKNVGGFWSYLYTHNASLDGGVEQGVKSYDPDAKGFKLWWQRTRWVCRNASYKFRAKILGYKAPAVFVDLGNGWRILEDSEGNRFFEIRTKINLTDKYRLRVWLGWTSDTRGGYHMLKAVPGLPERY